MANRTTIEEVKLIIATSITDPEIESYIGAANVFVTNQLGGVGLNDDTLAQIEKWITAHMIASTRERVAAEEEAGGARIKYVGKYGEGLNMTSYGQMAVMLDTSGTLATAGKQGMIFKAL